MAQVIALLEHSLEAVRKKAVMVLHRFHALQPEALAGHQDKLRRVLCDKVCGAALLPPSFSTGVKPPSSRPPFP